MSGLIKKIKGMKRDKDKTHSNENMSSQPSSSQKKSSSGNRNPFLSPGESGKAPPPAYTVEDPNAKAKHEMSKAVHKDEDRLGFLSRIDTVFLIDDSGSMKGEEKFYWREAATALSDTAREVARRDSDGVDMYFLNHKSGRKSKEVAPNGYYNLTTGHQVNQIFDSVEPDGGTYTGTRLGDILKPYYRRLEKAEATGEEVKPLNIIVITDGKALDYPEDIIVEYAKKLDAMNALPWQVGVQMFQVGNRPGVAKNLKELDEDLKKKHKCRDMLDTTKKDRKGPLTSDEIFKALMGAMQRRVDKLELVNGNLVSVS